MPQEPDSISKLVKRLQGQMCGRQFETFIDSLRLYSFKNIRDGATIQFKFPVTALVGPNGCGKSSVLQALFGCPEGRSLGTYWFSTSLDPISDKDGRRPSLVYTYKSSEGENREVVKTRIKFNKKKGASQNFDYWEPSRPLKMLGMTPKADGKRDPTIPMEVVVIDFRYQLSAFDRYFYLEDVDYYNRRQRRSKQDVMRLRSDKIIKAFRGVPASGRNFKPAHTLTNEECLALSRILGKTYKSGKILQHKFHGFWAHTVVFEVGSNLSPHKYTEANAGSGEVAVALLIYKLNRVNPGSLVLLDEPEYSLHPGAQKEVLRYLLGIAGSKNLQIVFTTHAPALIEGLPTSALKVFDINPVDEKFIVFENRSVEEAFVTIGQRVSSAYIIRVEDALAKAMLEECMRQMISDESLPSEFPNLVKVVFEPGGVTAMKKDMVSYSRDQSSVFMVFDGTEYYQDIIDLANLPEGDNTIESLESHLKDVTKIKKFEFHLDSGLSGGRADQHLEALRSYMQFWKERVWFLPFDEPEDPIWSNEIARNLLEPLIEDSAGRDQKLNKLTHLQAKERFEQLSSNLYGDSSSETILRLQTYFLKAWVKKDGAMEQVAQILRKIRESLPNQL